MMKLNVALKRCTVQVEGETQKDLFREQANAVEVFGERRCGLCGCEDIVPVTRKVEDYEFFEMACQNPQCNARLSYGQHKTGKGTLFPHRKLDRDGKPDNANGEYGPHRGWTKYRGEPRAE